MSAASIATSGSIRRRLILQLLAGAAVLALVLFLVVQRFAQQLAEESQDNILAASVTAILDAAAVREGELTLDIPYSAFSMLSNLSDDRVFYAIRAGDRVLTGYDDLPMAPATVRGAQFQTVDYAGEAVRMVTAARRLSMEDEPVTLTASVAQTRDGQRATLARISRDAAALGLGFFVSAAVLAWLAARSAVTPLRQLASSVARRGPQDLRPVTGPAPSEMVPLVAALNSFMERLGTSLARSEDFIAEAAHRVRTPLATVRTQAEITLRRVDRDENRASLREMIRAIDESSRAAGQLLDHAMVTFRADHLEAAEIDLSALAAEMTDRLRPLADLRDIDLSLDAPQPARVTGDAILLQNALRNLLDNAIKYSPADSTVTVRVSRDGAEARLSVCDEGPGFPEDGREGLTTRFARGSNVEGIVGSGLGLTIADEVTRAHHGTLAISNNPTGGGACVSLSFPSP